MKSLKSLVLLLGVYSTFAAVPISRVQRKTKLPTVPNKFIVEVDNAAHIPNPKRSTESVCYVVYLVIKATLTTFQISHTSAFTNTSELEMLVLTLTKNTMPMASLSGPRLLSTILR